MTSREAKEILLLHRPGMAEPEEQRLAEALELSQRDPELGRWFEQHRLFQRRMREKFRQVEVPAHLKTSILIRARTVRPPITPRVWWQSPVWATAAAMLVLLGLAAFWPRPAVPDRFVDFQSRMVGTALREYRMDIVTNDMRQVRLLMERHGAPANYQLTAGLKDLRLTGGGVLKWRSNPVAMVCFNRGDNQMLFLFVMNRSALKDAPKEAPQVSKVNDLIAASWSQGDKVYVLAGPPEEDFARKYLRRNS